MTCDKDHDCENKDSKYVKLTTQFVSNAVELDFKTPVIQIFKADFIIIDDVMVTDIGGQYFNKPPPDKPYGKTLLPFFQSFLC